MKSVRVTAAILLFLTLWACAPAVVAPPPASAPVPRQTADSLFSRAETLFSAGDFSAATAAYREMLARFPQSGLAPAAQMRIAGSLKALGDPAGARKAYETLVTNYPGDAAAVAARIALLEMDYDAGRFESLLAGVGPVLALNLAADQRLEVRLLAGDAAMALDQPLASAGHYAAAWTAAGPDRRRTVFEKLLSALRLMDAANLPQLLEGIESAQLREKVTELARELTFDRNTIGCLLPLSGPYETIGRRALRGVELALNRFAETAGGPGPEIRVADSAADPVRAKTAVERLAAEGAAAIIGPIATAEGAAQTAQSLQVPMIALTQKEGLAAIGDFVFRDFITPEMQVRALVAYTSGTLGLKRFAILYPAEPYGVTFMNLFWDAVIDAGGEVVGVESYSGDRTDFADPIEKLVGLYYPVPDDLRDRLTVVTPMAEDDYVDFDALIGDRLAVLESLYRSLPDALPPPPGFSPEEDKTPPRSHREDDGPDPIIDFDAIFIPEGPKKAALILPQLVYNDVTGIQLLGTNLWHADALIRLSGDYAQGALFPDGFDPRSDLPEVRDFVTRFQACYGEPPGFIEAVAYDSTRIVLELLAHPAVRSRAGLRDALGQLSHYPGVTGQTAFDPLGEARKNLFLLKVQGRRLVEVAASP